MGPFINPLRAIIVTIDNFLVVLMVNLLVLTTANLPHSNLLIKDQIATKRGVSVGEFRLEILQYIVTPLREVLLQGMILIMVILFRIW
jgi:hypothetical protein